jgi:hypothetical protein
MSDNLSLDHIDDIFTDVGGVVGDAFEVSYDR